MRVTNSIRKLQVWHVFARLILVVRGRSNASKGRELPLIQTEGLAGDGQATTNGDFRAVNVEVSTHSHEHYPRADVLESLDAPLTPFMLREYYPSMMTIATIPELVKAFGGTGRFAELLEVVPSAVSNWIREDNIPRSYHLQIYLESERRSIAIDLVQLGMAQQHELKPYALAAAKVPA